MSLSYECSTNNSDKGRACNYIGLYYCNSIGVNQDYKKAFEWFSIGAECGNEYCYDCLGQLYQYGYGVDVDLEKAKEYYKIAADMGNEDAADRLAELEKSGT